MKVNNGFTLIELLLVIGLLAILAGLAAPLGLNFYRSQLVESARGQLLETLSKARHNAVLMKGDSRYGVNIISQPLSSGVVPCESFTLYQGNSFFSRDSNYDEVYEQAPNLVIFASGSDDLLSGDINFAKLTGLTTATGTITIKHASGSESRSIIIDGFGNAYKQ